MEVDERKTTSFVKRFSSGIILLVLLFVVMYIGSNLLLITSLLVSLISLFELYKVFGISKNRLGILGYCLTVIYYIALYSFKIDGVLLFLILVVLSLLIFYVFSYPLFTIKDIAITLFGILYVAVLFSFIYLIRTQRGIYGKYLVWLIFIASWGCDTCAYCTGMIFGKHKLNKILSPNKTVEGMLGGILGSMLIGVIYVYVLYSRVVPFARFSLVRVSIACVIGSLISQMGDLVASAIKREYNIKDYGNIIPGHGGFLDRFDSVMFVAPALYFIFNVYK